MWLTGDVSGIGRMRVISDAGGRALTLSGAKTFTGGIVQSSGSINVNGTQTDQYPTIQIDDVGSLGSGTFHALINGSSTTIGVLRPIADLSAIAGVTNAFAIGNASRLVVNADVLNHLQLSGVIAGDGNLFKTGSATLILSGANTYVGTTTINAGTLQANNATALGLDGTITFGGGTLQFTVASAGQDWATRIRNSTGAGIIRLDTNGQNVTFAGAIAASNTAGLTKLGGGTLTLSGVNLYTGTTTVTAGTLLVNNPGSLAVGSPVIVNGGGTLGGDGTIYGPVTVVAGGILAPGTSAGTLNVGTVAIPSSVTMDVGAIYNWEFDGTRGDTVAVQGDLTLTSGWKLALVDAGGTPASGAEYDLFTYTNTLYGTIEANIIASPAGWPYATIVKDDTTPGARRIYLRFGLPGDADGDGVVDAADYITVKQNFGMTDAQWAQGDFSGDRQVNWTDLQILMTNFGTRSVGGAPAAPEPCSAVLLMFGAAALLRRRSCLRP
jgi:autotransporter-associated beta strand protein